MIFHRERVIREKTREKDRGRIGGLGVKARPNGSGGALTPPLNDRGSGRGSGSTGIAYDDYSDSDSEGDRPPS